LNADILRGVRLNEPSADMVEYTSSTPFDTPLIEPAIKINMAHIVMLVKQGLIDRREGVVCLIALKTMPRDMKLDPNLEDVHMNVEAYVAEKVGGEAGGNLNLAKSRNDQVSAAIRIALRAYILDILSWLAELRKTLLDNASKHLDTVMPGYTHLQHAQPTTLAHHLTAYHDMLKRDCERLMETYRRVNLSPLGAAALASTGLNIDRELTARLLGFDGIVENSMDAVSSRDFAVEALSDFALTMTDLSRIAEELMLWSSREFGVVDIPDEYASTSSIMPQKKNAVVAELIRAKASTVQGDLAAVLSIMKALPFSYNLDMQQLNVHIWDACEITLSSVKILSGMFKNLRFNVERLRGLLEDDGSTSTDLADHLSTKCGVPFRTAHRIVGGLVRLSLKSGLPLSEAVKKHLVDFVKREAGVELHINQAELDCLLDPEATVRSRSVVGGPGRRSVTSMIREGVEGVAELSQWVSDQRGKLEAAESELTRAVDELVKIDEDQV